MGMLYCRLPWGGKRKNSLRERHGGSQVGRQHFEAYVIYSSGCRG
jgi:hypothetical protein